MKRFWFDSFDEFASFAEKVLLVLIFCYAVLFVPAAILLAFLTR